MQVIKFNEFCVYVCSSSMLRYLHICSTFTLHSPKSCILEHNLGSALRPLTFSSTDNIVINLHGLLPNQQVHRISYGWLVFFITNSCFIHLKFDQCQRQYKHIVCTYNMEQSLYISFASCPISRSIVYHKTGLPFSRKTLRLLPILTLRGVLEVVWHILCTKNIIIHFSVPKSFLLIFLRVCTWTVQNLVLNIVRPDVSCSFGCESCMFMGSVPKRKSFASTLRSFSFKYESDKNR